MWPRHPSVGCAGPLVYPLFSCFMAFDSNFTLRLKEWLETPAADRSVADGAALLLRLTGNRLQYAAVMHDPARHAAMVEYQIQKHYDFRVADLTLDQLTRMSRDAASRMEADGIDESEASAGEEAARASGFGARPDHESLPEEIRQLYVDNLAVRRKMQQLHLRIRMELAGRQLTACRASDVYAFVRELLDTEKLYISNWERYDSAAPAAGGKETAEG